MSIHYLPRYMTATSVLESRPCQAKDLLNIPCAGHGGSWEPAAVHRY